MTQTITGALERAETLPDWGIEPVPADRRALSGFDVGVLWGNLGITLTLPVVGAFLVPGLSFKAALLAILVGSLIGNLMLAAAGLVGTDTGAPTMVTYRGPLGVQGSYLPTLFNVLQNIGWGAFELYIISVVMGGLFARYTHHALRLLWVAVFAVVVILMAVGGPVAVVRRWIRRYAVWLVIASSAYLTIYMLAKYPIASFWHSHGDGSLPFWSGVDLVVALPVSWVPLVADYNRFARPGRGAFWGTSVGYFLAQVWFFAIGVLLVLGKPHTNPGDTPGFVAALLAIPAGVIAMLILAVDELDEPFANVYSAAVSIQNAFPRWSQRTLSIAVGVVCAALALIVNLLSYQNFLYLLGALFVPLFGVLVGDYFVLRRGRYQTDDLYGERAGRVRLLNVLAWLVGFAAYNWINPGFVSWWTSIVKHTLGHLPHAPSWAGASLTSFVVSLALTVAFGPISLRRSPKIV